MAKIPLRHDSSDAASAPGTRSDPVFDYEAVVVSHDDGPDECTIFPADVDDDTLMTTWITAEADSFVALDEMR